MRLAELYSAALIQRGKLRWAHRQHVYAPLRSGKSARDDHCLLAFILCVLSLFFEVSFYPMRHGTLDVCMRGRKVMWLFLVALLLWPQLAPARIDETTFAPWREEYRALAVYTPRPTYPYEARARHLQGSGVAILTIDPATGNVSNAVMAVSTGAQILDNAAISAFSQWRFRPGTVSKVRLPITFTLAFGRGSVVMEVRVLKAPRLDHALAPFLGKENVIKASMPVYPANPPWTSKQGRGVYEIHVNKAGTVTDVKILKSSGDQTFDDVTVKTLHQWRLRNGPKIIELPLAFVMTPDNCRVWIP